MRLDRLFHVLVVMSAAPLLACESADDDERDERRDEHADAGVDPHKAASDAAPGEPCFCDTQTCCDRATSEPQVLDGFECCWSTTCP